MLATRFARSLLAALGLIAFTLWLPIAAITYVPGWHSSSCDWHGRCRVYGEERSQQRIDELRVFMQHGADLDEQFWTSKERQHLAEVRTLLDRVLVLALLGGLVFAHADAQQRARVARWVMIGAAACVIVLPFFGTFWRDYFHPLLFRNDLWRNNPADTSWWIMPRLYFQYTTALVIGSAVLLCALARYQALGQLRKKAAGQAA